MPLINVGKTDEIPSGMAKIVVVNGEPISVWNVNGEYYAIADVCSHEEASLAEGELIEEDEPIVECPLHGSQFDLRTGRAMTLPAIHPIATYPVHVEGDDVMIEV